MKHIFRRYPLDILLCIVVSVLILPLVFFHVDQTLRVLFGSPFILFIPGYVLIFMLFPMKKTEKGIDTIERIALSFGLSIAVVPLIGLILNFTPGGIRLESILLSLFGFVIFVGLLGWYRWAKINPTERFMVSLMISIPKSENRIDRLLTIILSIAIFIALAALMYVIITPKTGEKFTEFYLLNTERRAADYPTNFTIGKDVSVIIGIVNHEYRPIVYTVEVWIINQTTVYDNKTQNNETLYNHAWFLDSVTVMLNYTSVDIESAWEPQFEYNYTFNISQKGKDLKLAFLLFTTPTDDPRYNIDYKDSIAEKITTAYREIHLFVTVS